MLKQILGGPISESEIQQLAEYFADSAVIDTAINLTQAHGMLAAVVSAPTLIKPSQWQTLLLDGRREFNSFDEAQDMLNLLMHFYNNVCVQFQGKRHFEPFVWHDGKQVPFGEADASSINDWVFGYMLGAKLDPVWLSDETALAMMSDAGINLSGDESTPFVDELNCDEFVNTIEELHRYWFDRRILPETVNINELIHTPYQRTEAKVGRNSSCPCGSGKKFKKCCQAKRVLH